MNSSTAMLLFHEVLNKTITTLKLQKQAYYLVHGWCDGSTSF